VILNSSPDDCHGLRFYSILAIQQNPGPAATFILTCSDYSEIKFYNTLKTTA